MTWQKVSDDLWRHRKVGAIRGDMLLPCCGLWALSLSYLGSQLSDGFLSDRDLIRVGGPGIEPYADELMRVGLWERVEGGYLFHDYLLYNPSADQVMTAKAVREEAARKGGKARAGGAKRGPRGTFTSGNAGPDAGRHAGNDVQRGDQPRIPSPVSLDSRAPDAHNAGDETPAPDVPLVVLERDAEDEAWRQEDRWRAGGARPRKVASR